MWTYNQETDSSPDHNTLGIECMDGRGGGQDRSNSAEIVFEIARQAVAQEDAGQFLRKAAEILRGSDDYNLVQIWTLGPNQDHIFLSDCTFNTLRDLFVSRTIPALVGECRRGGVASETETQPDQATISASVSTVQRLVLPLCLRGKIFGLLSIENDRPDTFSTECLDIMNRVASLIASAFDKFKAIAGTRQSNEYLEGILNSATELAIIATDQQGYVVTGSPGTEAIFQLPLQSILSRDIITIFTDERFQQELAIYMGTTNAVALNKNRLKQTTEKGTRFLDVSFQRLCCSESNHIGFFCFAKDVTDSTLLQQKLEAASNIENLTGLFNRQHMTTALVFEIERCRLFNRSFSLCFLNLDNFKRYNEAQGNAKGDETIKAVAEIMCTLTRKNVDTCYRYEGDEFAVVMPETSAHDAARVSERILKQLRDTFDGAITASIGIAEYSPAFKAEDMIDKAVQTMYQAKTFGGDRVVFEE